MFPDSLTLAASLALFAACIGAWWLSASLRAAARLQLRFAAVLMAALAVATAVRLGDTAALLLLPLAGAALALAAIARFARPASPLAATLALVAALASGRLAAAACDVHYQEPVADDEPLLKFDNLLLTPHFAGGPRQTLLIDIEEIASNIQQALAPYHKANANAQGKIAP